MEILMMKWTRWLFFIFINLYVVASAEDVIGNAVAVLGTVSVVRASDGVEESLVANSEIYLNDTIQTGADGLAKLLLRDESILKVSPNSQLVISDMIAGPGEGGTSAVELLKGRIRSVIGNKLGANSEFTVNTPVAVAGVRGTDFEVVHLLIDGQWLSGVRTFDGVVAFNGLGDNSASVILVLPNQYSLASETQSASEPVNIESDASFLQLLGVNESGTSGQMFEIQTDDLLDIQQVQSLLLHLDTSVDIDIKSVITRISITTDSVENTTNDANDVQLDVITEPVASGAELKFEIDIPLPQ